MRHVGKRVAFIFFIRSHTQTPKNSKERTVRKRPEITGTSISKTGKANLRKVNPWRKEFTEFDANLSYQQ